MRFSAVRPAPRRRKRLETRYGEHPSRYRGTALEPTRLSPDIEEHLADQVLGRRLIADEAHHKPEHAHVVTRVQNLHGQPIAVRYSSNQHLV